VQRHVYLLTVVSVS